MTLCRRLAAGLTAALLTVPGLLAPPQSARAQIEPPIPGRRPPIRPPFPPPPPRPDWQGVVVASVDVEARVRDGVAETDVTHVFENRSSAPQEGDFVFPIPAGASISRFAMYEGEKRLEAKMLDADEATRAYEEIVRRRRDPALLSFVGRGALRARVFPIAPHSQRRVTLKLAMVLPREGDAKKYAWLLAGPHLPGTGTPEKVSVRVVVTSSQPIGNLYSPTHDTRVRREGDDRAVVSWESRGKGDALAPENREFALYIAPGDKRNVALSVLTYNAALPQVASLGGGARESGYFLVVASPALTDAGRTALPRRVVIVFDRSGSMQGKKIEQAREALRFALGRLRPGDRFNVLTFSDGVERFSPEPIAATEDNLKRARAFVDDIIADGGTNIDEALRAGLAQFPERSSGNTLLFLTDGLPTVGNTDKDAIVRRVKETNARRARAFVFGVGYDVDVPFLDTVAQTLRGDADYVRPDEDIEVKVSRYVAKTSAPVLTDLKLTVSGAKTGEIYPRPDDLPDLFLGSQLVLVGRYTGGGNAPVSVALAGEANGKPQTYTISARFPAVDTDADFLPRLWATRKVGYLLDEVRLREGDARKEIVDQIVSLSKEFGILTPYTALFVPEPVAEVFADNAAAGRVLREPAQIGGFAGGRGGGGGGFGGAAPAAPAATTEGMKRARVGESAVNLSQGARAQRTQNQIGNVYAYGLKAGVERDKDEQMARRIQNVASRTFYQVGPVWTDAVYDAAKQKQIVRVRLYSPAYFALIRRNADLGKWAALGEQVLIAANATQAVQFGPEGRDSLTEAELRALAGK
jgi:Ca-activated chloride channel family protein